MAVRSSKIKIGTVKAINGTKISMTGYGNELLEIPLVSMANIETLPVVGEIAIIEKIEDNYCYIGKINMTSTIRSGEVKITSKGGGYIHLRDNGTVVINGMVITTDGKILGG